MTNTESFTQKYLDETVQVLKKLDTLPLEKIAEGLRKLRDNGGRLFILGVGGSAGHASHAVNDFRKICHIESYAPTDNVSELTARTNDEGWETSFSGWLHTSQISSKDALLIFSVGGGNKEHNISMNIVKAIDLAIQKDAKIYGIVGRDGGYTKSKATSCVIIPPLVEERTTPHTEGLCAVLWHLLVSHPTLKVEQTKWESQKTAI